MVPKKDDTVELVQPRLKTLKVKNFRCIGNDPVEIDLDEIVVLVGPNNVGKSSILRAYEVVMSHGSKEGELTLEDFPNGRVDSEAFPEIELVTVVKDNTPGDEWISINENKEIEVRERWFWPSIGKATRQGWNVKEKDWSDKVPWGAPNVANSRRPEPHRVGAFDSPEKQADEIAKILIAVLMDRIKTLEGEAKEKEDTPYRKLLENVKEIQKAIVQETKDEIEKVEEDLCAAMKEVFPYYTVIFDAKPEEDLEKSIRLFHSNPQLKMGPDGGFLCSVDRQGSGARRTLLWTALKVASEKRRTVKSEGRPHVLLLEEPEICLHPNAIREACNLLYDLPQNGNWQVMVTTHSPCFVDVSRDNTTIIRVEREAGGRVTGTTIFRPTTAQLDPDDKQRLKLLNICDPYVAEFFFGGRTIVVEGDTEYTAFNYVREMKYDEFRNIHVVRARGKATIVSLMKILNHFETAYAVLHDVDPKIITRQGKNITNPAWTKNFDIMSEADKARNRVTLVASIPNFEEAYFDKKVTGEKPYTALLKLREGGLFFDNVYTLLTYLVGSNSSLPQNAIAWKKREDLETLDL